MTKSIPAKQFVNITPGVVNAGGAGLSLIGLALTSGTRVPMGSVLSFPSQLAVASYFGAASAEAASATIYFNGFDNSFVKPGAMLWAQYNTAPVSAFMRGGSLSAMTLSQLQALTGTVILTVDGTLHTSGTITLSAATSFSNAATIILAGFTSPGFTVTYDSVSGAFVFTSSTTGASSTMTVATGTLATSLALTTASGAVLSQGATTAVPAVFMTGVVNITQNWASFYTVFDPDGGSGNALKLAFAEWNNGQEDDYVYIVWDSDITPTESSSATASLGDLLAASDVSGTCLIYVPSSDKAAYQSGAIASVDFSRTNGRTNFAWRGQTGLSPDVTDATTYNNLIANGYNAYVAMGTRSQTFLNMQPGSISGPYLWLDSYVNQIWLNAALQQAGVELLAAVPSIPANEAGRALIRAAFMDPINAALNFGAMQPGVTLSALQIAEVNNAAGVPIDTTLSAQGYYLQILPATPQNRALRKSPQITLWYMDGESVNTLDLSSLVVQ